MRRRLLLAYVLLLSVGSFGMVTLPGSQSARGVVLPGATPLAVGPGTPQVWVKLYDEANLFPPDCSPEQVAETVLGFMDAVNRGDPEAAVQFFTAESRWSSPHDELAFRWYTVGGRPNTVNPGFGAYHRDDLIPYFAERHAQNERMHLLHLSVGYFGDGDVGMLFNVHRQADDIPTHVAGGKGGFGCPTQTIHGWSMGDAPAISPSRFETPGATPCWWATEEWTPCLWPLQGTPSSPSTLHGLPTTG